MSAISQQTEERGLRHGATEAQIAAVLQVRIQGVVIRRPLTEAVAQVGNGRERLGAPEAEEGIASAEAQVTLVDVVPP